MSLPLSIEDPRTEWLCCRESPAYFVMQYVQIYNATQRRWMPFALWPAQRHTLRMMQYERLLVILKARQLGLSWLSLSYALWLLVTQAPATVLLFSRREAEAVELLARLNGMYQRLPHFLQSEASVRDASRQLELSIGSRALAFSTEGGRSYTGTLAIVDEADFTPDLGRFLNAVKPTIDAGGQLFLISTSDKRRPVSTFKRIFRAAAATEDHGVCYGGAALRDAGDYRSVFLPWHAHPARDAAWHVRTKAEMYAQRGTDDDFYAEYPATPEEALAPEQLDRRIPFDWIKPCIGSDLALGDELAAPLGRRPDLRDGARRPAIPNLAIYRAPHDRHRYVIGADAAEGNPNSDDSAATVMDAETWEEVAALALKAEPTVFAAYLDELAAFFQGADILPERNNHGHSLIAALRASGRHRVLNGYDGKPGWLSNVKGKVLLYDACADAIRDRAVVIRNAETVSQLASIEAGTLRSPEGLLDDRADSFALAVAALSDPRVHAQASVAVPRHDPLAGVDEDGW